MRDGMAMTPSEFLDVQGLSGLQWLTLILCGLVGVLDGADTQVMAVGAPLIAAALHLHPAAMGWAISGSLAGAAAGALILGSLADRVGRRWMLIVSVGIFAVFTLLTPVADTLSELVVFRVLAGLGLGGAAPCFIALSSEYAPLRVRGAVVSIVWASFPLGLLIGGLLYGWLLAHYAWPVIFLVGGGMPAVLCLSLVVLLPESPEFLIGRGDPSAIRRLMVRIAPDADLASVQWVAGARTASGGGVGQLFREGRWTITLCLWLTLFTCFGTTASMSWVPTILRQSGASPSAASVAASFLGVGALIGMPIAGRLIDRFGPARGLGPAVVVGAIATALMGFSVHSVVWASAFTALVGCFVGIGAAGGIALLTLVYPVTMRSSGAGWSMSMGRFGQVVMPGLFGIAFGSGWSLATIFLTLGLVPLVGAATVITLDRFVPARRRRVPVVPPEVSAA